MAILKLSGIQSIFISFIKKIHVIMWQKILVKQVNKITVKIEKRKFDIFCCWKITWT